MPKDMAANNYLNHQGQDGPQLSPRERLMPATTRPRAVRTSPAERKPPALVMNGWVNSPDHLNNILNQEINEIGVGYAADGHYWVQVFGMR